MAHPTAPDRESRVPCPPPRFRVPNEQHLPRLLAQFHCTTAKPSSNQRQDLLTAHLQAAGSNNARAM